ncbi:MAG TPA: SCO family protein [Gemmataceae bacterium]|nr:SCO family protein [Gemmataceae bacterium]
MLAAVLALLALQSGALADESDAPPILREVSLRQKLDSQVPLDAEFRDEQGQAVTLGECMAGKTTILVMAYYKCPKLCTQVLNDLASGLTDVRKRTSWELGESMNVVTVGFDDRETPEQAAAKKESYMKEYRLPNMDQGWHFLTGRQQSILRVANAIGFQFRYDPKNDLFAHPACIVILTPQGKVSRYFLGLADKTFARDLRLGLEEASEHKIGTPITDRIVLSCFYYDPDTGKYTMTALNIVRAAGVVTVLVLGSVLFVVWRREWRKVIRDPKGSAPDALPFGSRINDGMGMS